MRVYSLLCVALAGLSGCLGATFTAATVDDGGAPGPGPGGSSDMAEPPAAASDLAGVTGTNVGTTISADAEWSGLINIASTTTIAAGATVTVMPGTVVSVAPSATLVVQGSLVAHGTAVQPIQFTPASGTQTWGGLTASSGGSLDLAYAQVLYTVTPIACQSGATLCQVDHTLLQHYIGVGGQLATAATLTYVTVEFGGGDGITITAATGQTVTITDSTFHMTGGDATVVASGNLTFNHNLVHGDTSGGGTGVHCACHYSGTGTFLVDHNDFYDAVYGFMASGMGATSKVNDNNFYQNGYGWGTADGSGVNAGVDLTNNYWGGGPPPSIMGNSRTTPYSMTKISGTGPR